MKSNVFTGEGISFEYENVVAVGDMGFKLDVYLFGGFIKTLESASDISHFKIWYNIYLQNKYLSEENKEEEVVGL